MKKCRRLLSFRVLCLILVLMPGLGITGSSDKAMVEPLSRLSGKWLSPSLATSVTAAMSGLREKTIHLVDIRKASDFERFYIPGSVNISVHAIHTKAYLKGKPVVLVNEGYALGEADQACRMLNTAGFKATILSGGLLAWQARGGRLEGDPFGMLSLNRVPPSLFLQEQEYHHHLVAAPVQNAAIDPGAATAGAVAIDMRDPVRGAAELKKLVQKNAADPFFSILVLADNDRENERIQSDLALAGMTQVYFLQGGRRAYNRYLNSVQLASRPEKERKVSTTGCPGCGHRKDSLQQDRR